MENFEIEPGIFEFKNHLTDQECDTLLNYFESNPENHHKGKAFRNGESPSKKSIDCYLQDPELQNLLNSKIENFMPLIIKKYQILGAQPLSFTGMQIQKYLKGEGRFLPHLDNNFSPETEDRLMAMIYYLNDVEDGGETYFNHQDISVKPEKGKLVVFSCTWQYLHEGRIPLSNDKFIITRFITLPKE
jgi:hypothetical protein